MPLRLCSVFLVSVPPHRICGEDIQQPLACPHSKCTHLHTAQCSPGKTELCTGADTRRREPWPRAVPPAVPPQGSYTQCSERAQDPHTPGRWHGRLHREQKAENPKIKHMLQLMGVPPQVNSASQSALGTSSQLWAFWCCLQSVELVTMCVRGKRRMT